MSWGSFVRDQVEKTLIQEGFSPVVARGGARHAEDLYNRMSQASRKGGIFDDALRHGRLWAEKQTLPADRFDSKRAKRDRQHGLF